MQNKPGFKTTEFGFTLVPYVVLIIKNVFGVELESDIIVEGLIALIALVNTALYIWSRTAIKVANSNQVVEVRKEVVSTPSPELPRASDPVVPQTETTPVDTTTIAHVDNQVDTQPVNVVDDSQ